MSAPYAAGQYFLLGPIVKLAQFNNNRIAIRTAFLVAETGFAAGSAQPDNAVVADIRRAQQDFEADATLSLDPYFI